MLLKAKIRKEITTSTQIFCSYISDLSSSIVFLDLYGSTKEISIFQSLFNNEVEKFLPKLLLQVINL